MKRWYVVWTKARQERRAFTQLSNQGFEVFAPYVQERKSGSDGIQWIIVPLFPRYIFIQADCGQHSLGRVRSTRGCIDLVRSAGSPLPIADELVREIHRRVEAGVRIGGAEAWSPGQKLMVIAGPLAGVDALFEECSGASRARVLIDFLGRKQSALVADDHLVAVAS